MFNMDHISITTWNVSMLIRHWVTIVMFDSVGWNPRRGNRFKVIFYVPYKTFATSVRMLILFEPFLRLFVGFPIESSPKVRTS